MFCKYSLNAFWFTEDLAALREHVDVFLGALRPEGWGWIAPWNRVPKSVDLTRAEVAAVLDTRVAAFNVHGFAFQDVSEDETRRYGVHGATDNNALFTRGL